MKLRNFAILLMTASILANCSSRRGGPADVEYDAYQSPYHVVRRGETIASIANRYHIDKHELVRLNGMKPPYRIVVGQKLLVGAHKQSAGNDFYSTSADGSGFYTSASAQEGDVQVSQLAPLPGTEEYADEPQSFDRSGQMDDEDAADAESGVQAYKPLGEAPKTAAFYSWPVRGKVIRGFSNGSGGKKGVHTGINISAPRGTPVKAANNGIISRTEQIPGYGKVILVRHQDGFISVYAHLDQITVKRGDTVAAGQKIGTVGKTGNVKEPQLHFKLNKGKTPVDPTKYLD
jgi:lipoprotein NlpD